MNGYEVIAKILKKEGFQWMACFPANPLIEAVAKEGIQPITFRQERGAIMAADAYSRNMASKGKYGLFACQGGPGIENSFGGIAQAYADSVPILFLPDSPGNYKSEVKPIKYKEWHDSVEDIINNIDVVSYMNITGGEPLQLPAHWKP